MIVAERMKFFLIPVASIIICQLIKLGLSFRRKQTFSIPQLVWDGFWIGKFPSSHAAVLTSSLYLLALYAENTSIIAFAVFISLLVFYGLLEDKKRQEIWEIYIAKSSDTELNGIVTDGILRDFNGHSLFQLAAGVFIGLVSAVVIDKLF